MMLSFEFGHRIIKSKHRLGWKEPFRSWSPEQESHPERQVYSSPTGPREIPFFSDVHFSLQACFKSNTVPTSTEASAMNCPRIKKRGKHLKVRQMFPESKLIWFICNRNLEFYLKTPKICCIGHTLMTILPLQHRKVRPAKRDEA